MPSLQTALPPELANNVIRLYRECLRRAKYIGHKQHNTALVVDMVRQQFKKHMHETDPEKIQKLKDEFVSQASFVLGLNGPLATFLGLLRSTQSTRGCIPVPRNGDLNRSALKFFGWCCSGACVL